MESGTLDSKPWAHQLLVDGADLLLDLLHAGLRVRRQLPRLQGEEEREWKGMTKMQSLGNFMCGWLSSLNLLQAAGWPAAAVAEQAGRVAGQEWAP
jgi:hypothetical protein